MIFLHPSYLFPLRGAVGVFVSIFAACAWILITAGSSFTQTEMVFCQRSSSQCFTSFSKRTVWNLSGMAALEYAEKLSAKFDIIMAFGMGQTSRKDLTERC